MLPAQWACAAWFSRHQTFQKWLMALIVLLVFSFAGTFVYMALEPEWNLFDAMYFTFTIISTVGYGCMGPSTYASRAFTLFYVVASVPIFAGALSATFAPLVDYPYAYIIKRIKLFSVESDDPLNPPGALKFYARGLTPVFIWGHCFLCFLMAVACWAKGQTDDDFANSLAEPGRGKLYFFDALYFTVITSSTVGFGDICPVTSPARVFVVYVASFGLAIVGFFINEFTALVEERGRIVERARQLNLEALGTDLIDKLDISGDGKLDRFEYVVGMFLTLGLVKEQDVTTFLAAFDRIDADKNGYLTREEILQVLEERAKEVKGLRNTRDAAYLPPAAARVMPAKGEA